MIIGYDCSYISFLLSNYFYAAVNNQHHLYFCSTKHLTVVPVV